MNLTDAISAAQALRDSRATGDPEKVARAAMGNIWPLYNNHFDELTTAVESLPVPVLHRYPVLRILHRMTPVLARTAAPFKPLIYPDDARNMSSDELDILTMVQMIAFRLSGDVAAAMIYARRLQERIIGEHGEARDRVDGPLWFYHHQIGSTFLAAGDSSAALREFGTAYDLGVISRQPDAERMILGRMALAHAVRGSVDDAERALQAIDALPAPSAAHRVSTNATERTSRALVSIERMAPDSDKLLGQLETYDSFELTWPFALLARTRRLLTAHHTDEALEAVQLARDAHLDQHGAFASDVINATSIEAMWSAGDRSAARRVVASATRSGYLTQLAIIRLDLLDAQLDDATRGLRELARDRSLGPGPRAESVLLSAWLEYLLTDALSEETALQVARIAERPSMRRLLSSMPTQLIRKVQQQLPSFEAAAFDAATAGLGSVNHLRPPALTPSELRVLKALPQHKTTAEIAAALFVSPNTIKSQLKSLYRKLHCSNREEAIAAAIRYHLLPDGAAQGR